MTTIQVPVTTQTFIGTAENGTTRAATTIARINGRILNFGYEDNAGSRDSTDTFTDEAELADYIQWITSLGYKEAAQPWDVYLVEIVCDRGRCTYTASHDPAVAVADWAREQLTLCAAQTSEPWRVRVYDVDADTTHTAPVAEVTGDANTPQWTEVVAWGDAHPNHKVERDEWL